jgi:hypothetical protein
MCCFYSLSADNISMCIYHHVGGVRLKFQNHSHQRAYCSSFGWWVSVESHDDDDDDDDDDDG